MNPEELTEVLGKLPNTEEGWIDRANKAKAKDPDVQKIWDRRNALGQPCLYLAPFRPYTKGK